MPDARVPVRGRSHVTRTRVRFGETDAAGIVFYPTFFAWFDAGMTGLLRGIAGGRAMHEPDGRPRLPVPIVESGARFISPLYYDDAIAIRSTVVELGRSSLRVEHVVLRGAEEVARGFEVRVLIGRAESGRMASVPLPDDLRAALSDGTSNGDDEVA